MANEIVENESAQEDGTESDSPHHGVFLAGLLAAYLLLLNSSIGRHDLLALFFVLVGAWLVFKVIREVRHDIREFFKHLFREGSTLHQFLEKRSRIQAVIAVIFTAYVTLGFAVVFKTLNQVNGVHVNFILIFLICFLMGLFSRRVNLMDSLKDNVQNPESAEKMSHVFVVLRHVLILNISLVVTISGYDAMQVVSGMVNFSNFHEYAERNAISPGDFNTYSRALVNMTVILDAFKAAAVNEVMAFMGLSEDASRYFTFLSIVIIFNFFKILPVSIAIVFIYYAFRDHYLGTALRAYMPIENGLSRAGEWVRWKRR